VILEEKTKKSNVQQKVSKWNIFKKGTTSANSVSRPMSNLNSLSGSKKKGKSDKNEIFVDIFEKLSVLFNQNGSIINSQIDGIIQMKSYLKGNPGLRLVLNDDLVVGGNPAMKDGKVMLDDCAFHESVDLTDFDAMKTLAIDPPDGEFLVMNYRINGDYQTPFRLYPFIDELS
jgi:AP-4 complex subunit mu-1